MKQQERKILLVFPKKKPKAIRGVHKWHCKLLEDCILNEFKKRALEAAIRQIDEEIRKYIQWLKKDNRTKGPILLALKCLNKLKDSWKEDLIVTKNIIRVIHDTNEMIIGTLVKGHGGENIIHHFQKQNAIVTTNLLHEPGWLYEVLSAEYVKKKGHVGFITFGTLFDPNGFDVIRFSKPGRTIKWKFKYPSPKKRTE